MSYARRRARNSSALRVEWPTVQMRIDQFAIDLRIRKDTNTKLAAVVLGRLERGVGVVYPTYRRKPQ